MLWFRIAKSQNHPITNHLESPLMSPEERAKKIKVLVFDVDGVLTDGKIWLFPAPAGAELKTQQQAQPKADAGGYAIVSERVMGSNTSSRLREAGMTYSGSMLLASSSRIGERNKGFEPLDY